MPKLAPKPCCYPGCAKYSVKYSRCQDHQPAAGWSHTLSSTQRGYGTYWSKLRKVVLLRDSYICQCSECASLNRLRNASEVDHILPKSQGGTNAIKNLQAINKECHKQKTIKERNYARSNTNSTESN